jgi:hypothetical protein
MPVVLRKYSRSVPSKQSKTVKWVLSRYRSPLRVPRDHRLGPVAELADPLERPVHSARDLLDEGFAPAEHVPGRIDEQVRVARVREVVGGEDERLGEAAVAPL